jgi:hypothetical protein
MPVKSARKPARKSAAPRRLPSSGGRILTTHVGSLVRPPALREFLAAQRDGQLYDETGFRQDRGLPERKSIRQTCAAIVSCS